MFIFPSLFYIFTFLSFYLIHRYKKLSQTKAFIYSYLFSLILITILSKLILITKIIYLSKFIFFAVMSVELIIVFKLFNFIRVDLKELSTFFNIKNTFFIILFFYLLVQSLVLPPANFDSLAYHIQRNYLFINENTIYPIFNAHYGNQVFQALNSDLLFFFFAVFKSNVFMSIFSFFSFLTITVLLFKAKSVLNLKKEVIFTTFLMLLSLSSLILSSLSTKNDIMIASFGIILIYLFYDFIKFNSKSSLSLFIISTFYAFGIKWNFVFYLLSIFPFFIFYIHKYGRFFIFFKYSIIMLPLILMVGPFETIFFNLSHDMGPIGPYDHVEGHTNPDGLIGLASNLIRNFFLLFDITLPLHYFGLTSITNFFDHSLNFLLSNLFDNTKLGISEQIKWLEFDYAYNLKPHSDYTGYSLIGFAVTLLSFHYLIFGGNIYLRIFSFISISNIIIISYSLTWQPWILRYFMISLILNIIVSTEYIKKIRSNKLVFINSICILILIFNIFANISQPLIKHSQTPSWFKVFQNRDKYQSYAIPEMNKINNFLKKVSDNNKIVIVLNREGSQTPYEIMRKSDNYYIFTDKNFNRYLSMVYFKSDLKINLLEFDYVLNITDEKLNLKDFKIIQESNTTNFEIFKKNS